MSLSLTDSMCTAGFDPPNNITPGKITRFSTNGKRSDLSGWVYMFPDGQGAAYGCWRSGVQHVWQEKHHSLLNAAEQVAFKRKITEAKKAAHAERKASYKQATQKALSDWKSAKPAHESHPYLLKKGIKAHMARVDSNGWLLIPVYGIRDELQSLQRISPDGQKRFMSGGSMRYGHVWLGEPENGATLLLCEGFATADSLYWASGYAVCVCFSVGNLRSVAEHVRKRYPIASLLICGDDDTQTDGNPGRSKASEAAQAVAAGVVFPPGGDFNDLAQANGLEAVRGRIEQALQHLPAIKSNFKVPALSGTDARDGTENTRPLSELGNATRLFDIYGKDLRYVYDAKAWLHWRDGAWQWDNDSASVRSLAARLPKQIYEEGSKHLSDAHHFAKWARTSQKERTIEAAVSLLMNFEPLRSSLAQVDADSFLIGFDHARHVIDLKTGKARPAKQTDLITKTVNVSQLGNSSKAIRWLSFLDQVFISDTELIDWIQRWCGYLLTGSTREQIFVFCFGLGANGKSVFAELLRSIVGDYARTIQAESLSETKRQAGGATPDLAELIGTRLAMSSETEDGVALAESLVKSLVAGDTMSVRKLYSAPIQFQPQFKLLMLGNHKPIIRGNDYGIWRRVRLIPFKRKFMAEERDPDLLDKLKAEAPHILAWMIDGCIEWQKRGLADVPTTIKQATGEYQEEQDVFGRWLAECCRFSPGIETASTVIYNNYKQWCNDNGLKFASNISFGRRLGERGFSSRRSSGATLWSGIGVNRSTCANSYRTASGR